jgi:hypothetical protein
MHRAARRASDYTGAMLAGGRWNPIGTPMLYTAEHLSLACIEILVHVDKNQLPRDYVWLGPHHKSGCSAGAFGRHPGRVQHSAQPDTHRLRHPCVE